jgi:hypothetical protein
MRKERISIDLSTPVTTDYEINLLPLRNILFPLEARGMAKLDLSTFLMQT